MTRRRLLISLGVTIVVAAVAVASVVALGGRTETSVPTTTTTTSTVPPPPWPLTGVPAAASVIDGARPAVVVKVDNSPEARPQLGVAQADIVYELLVEGITRFALVFHSEIPDPVGPVRSARSSDVDLVADLSTPLFAWSGGNAGVVGEIRQAEREGLLTNASWDSAPSAYFRSADRRAPHNLMVNVPELLAVRAPAGQGAPAAIFEYLPTGVPFEGLPLAGMTVDFGGGVVIDWVWDPMLERWVRYQIDDRHDRVGSATLDVSGAQVAVSNVVVMFTPYGVSPSDDRSPMALTIGSGPAMVFVESQWIPATWSRPDARAPAQLFDEAGLPVRLAPGRTWVELPRPGSAVLPIEVGLASQLLALPR